MEFVIPIILAITILAAAIKVVKEYERIVVFRLGRFFKIAGPGLVLLIPLIDKGVKVNLKDRIPGWHNLSPQALEERIKKYGR
jgi:regulator of protease activity HflC (stomatin/prohibitin superfamily)